MNHDKRISTPNRVHVKIKLYKWVEVGQLNRSCVIFIVSDILLKIFQNISSTSIK